MNRPAGTVNPSANRHSTGVDRGAIQTETRLTPSKIPPYRVCPMRLLVAEDDAPLAEFLQQRLQQEQFGVEMAASAVEAQQLVAENSYDLAILDLNQHGNDGLEVMRQVRAIKPELPVLIVTNASMIEERVRGLDSGADDLISKPFAFAELAARIRAVLRRGNRQAKSVLKVEDLELDRMSHCVTRAGQDIELSPKEYSLLEFLMRNAGQPVARTAIVEQVWKLHFDTMTNVVDVYINYLRRKVDTGYERALIRTVRGVGYQIGGNGSARAKAAGQGAMASASR